MWTPEELAAIAAADAEIEADFRMTSADYADSASLDRAARNESMDNRQRAIAAYQRAYYEENKEAIAAYQRAYRARRKEQRAHGTI